MEHKRRHSRDLVTQKAWRPALWALLLCCALFPASALAQRENILIFRPLDANREIFVENEDGLLIVPGGRVFLFEVEISAFAPLLELRINGRRSGTPGNTWALLKTPQFLHPGKNRIVVEAATRSDRVSREFIIELRRLPGFHKGEAPAPSG
jgi:hypothetical protein